MDTVGEAPQSDLPSVLTRRRRQPRVFVHQWLSPSATEAVRSTRAKTRGFLSSKYGHYVVLLLVVLDVLCIFVDFIITIFACERRIDGRRAEVVIEALDWTSLAFSCLFMVELIVATWAFGLRYFRSWFHCFDAFIILLGFSLDVALRGIEQEAASFVVFLRLWRVFKIFEELTLGAKEHMEQLLERIDELEREVVMLRSRS